MRWLRWRRRLNIYRPKNLLLQWHITERCNLSCKHCYQDDVPQNELEFDELIRILDDFKALISEIKLQDFKAHINVTGGEPFIRDDFISLLELFHSNKAFFSYGILTNGTFIDTAMAKYLAKLKPGFIQISLEGGRLTHDEIRGEGNYEQSINAIRNLTKAGIKTLMAFTAHQSNYHEFKHVASLGKRLGVSRVWADRLIPCGRGSEMKTTDPAQTKELFEIMNKERKRFHLFHKTEIAMQRALQFLIGGGIPYNCAAGKTLITIQSNGDLYPCRRMPVSVGNVMETDIRDLYANSTFFNKLRDMDNIHEVCRKCFYVQFCQGGLKCLSYAIYGSPFMPDPGCWIAKELESAYFHK